MLPAARTEVDVAVTVFYSWQSDLDNRVTRQLIRDALEAAIEQVAQDLQLDDAPRLDQDTQGVPGTPEVAATILQKIEQCRVIVADVSMVASTARRSRATGARAAPFCSSRLPAAGTRRRRHR